MIIRTEGIWNMRDVGGMPAARGRIRAGVLLRSGHLSRATPADVALVRSSVRHILDLRDDSEAIADPSAIADVATTRLPLFLGSVASFFQRDVTLEDLYRHLVAESSERLVQAVRLIATGESGTLVHCAVGKDRTGVTVALALSAVGAEREAVIADYALTESQLPAEWNRQIAGYLRARHPEARNAIAMATSSPAPVMRALLTGVDAEYGSVADYLRAHGLADDELALLRTRLVEG